MGSRRGDILSFLLTLNNKLAEAENAKQEIVGPGLPKTVARKLYHKRLRKNEPILALLTLEVTIGICSTRVGLT